MAKGHSRADDALHALHGAALYGDRQMYYAQYNLYGSTADVGFSDTWGVASFVTKSARDAWVSQRADRLDVAAITKADALKIAGRYLRHQHRNGGHLAHVHYLTDDNATFVRAF